MAADVVTAGRADQFPRLRESDPTPRMSFRDRLPENGGLGGIGRGHRAFEEGGEFRARELAPGIETAGKTNELHLFLRRQRLDLVDLARRHGPTSLRSHSAVKPRFAPSPRRCGYQRLGPRLNFVAAGACRRPVRW